MKNDIYTKVGVKKLFEQEELDDDEVGFMLGYLQRDKD